jgi:hypothetical protein
MQVMAVDVMGIRNPYKILARKLKEIDQFEGMGTDQRIILKYILKKQKIKGCPGVNWIRIGFQGGLL